MQALNAASLFLLSHKTSPANSLDPELWWFKISRSWIIPPDESQKSSLSLDFMPLWGDSHLVSSEKTLVHATNSHRHSTYCTSIYHIQPQGIWFDHQTTKYWTSPPSHPWFRCCVKNPRTRLALRRQQVDQFAMAFAKVLQSPQNLLQHFCNRFYTNLQCICYGCTISWVKQLRSFTPTFNERFRIFVDLWSAMSARCTSQPLWV